MLTTVTRWINTVLGRDTRARPGIQTRRKASIKYRINGALFRFHGTVAEVQTRAKVLRANGIDITGSIGL